VRRTGPETPDRLQWGSLAPDFLLGRLAFFFCYFLKPPSFPVHRSPPYVPAASALLLLLVVWCCLHFLILLHVVVWRFSCVFCYT
jgi:hypothetical protein